MPFMPLKKLILSMVSGSMVRRLSRILIQAVKTIILIIIKVRGWSKELFDFKVYHFHDLLWWEMILGPFIMFNNP